MHNVINKKSIIFFSIAIIVILLSSYLRIYQINKTYSEYDENFMIALHKITIIAIEKKIILFLLITLCIKNYYILIE